MVTVNKGVNEMSSNTLSQEQFFQKYGELEVEFSSYYKFAFLFTAKHENVQVTVRVGGESESIYALSVEAGAKISINELQPSSGWVEENGQEIEEFGYESW